MMDVASLASNEMVPVGVAIIAINFVMLWFHSRQQSKELDEIKDEQNKLEIMILKERKARSELNVAVEKVLTTVEFIKETLTEIKSKL